MSQHRKLLIDAGTDQPKKIAEEVSRIVGFPIKEADKQKNALQEYVIICKDYSLFIGMSVMRRLPNTPVEEFDPPWDTHPISITVIVWSSRFGPDGGAEAHEATVARELFDKLKSETAWRILLADDVYEILDQWDPNQG